MDFSRLLDMGGYAGFVWPAYALGAVVMIALLVASLREARAREDELEALQQTRPNRRPRPSAGGNEP